MGHRGFGRRVAAATAFAVLLSTGAANAIEWEKLVMPGDLAALHADLENDCQQCHRPFDASAEGQVCQVCHEEVSADLGAGTGYHGLDPRVGAQDCRSCHPDHRGRDFDLLGLDPATFDHAMTDMPLLGAHRAVACVECHEPEKKHHEASTDCVACHREDDSHQGTLGDDCGSCHEQATWRSTRFDHDTTDYPLVGGLCHPGGRYEQTPTDCASCHRLDDAHAGRFGTDCSTCHDPEG